VSPRFRGANVQKQKSQHSAGLLAALSVSLMLCGVGSDPAPRSAALAALAAHMIAKVAPDRSRYLLCPMPGLVMALGVKAGDIVEAGQALATVEAMKMENILRAEKSGTLMEVRASVGESLAVDAVILEFEV
jgi:propionyl-CoA carboxylase alpha chain